MTMTMTMTSQNINMFCPLVIEKTFSKFEAKGLEFTKIFSICYWKSTGTWNKSEKGMFFSLIYFSKPKLFDNLTWVPS